MFAEQGIIIHILHSNNGNSNNSNNNNSNNKSTNYNIFLKSLTIQTTATKITT